MVLRMMVCSGKKTQGPATHVPILWYTHYAALVPLVPADKGTGSSTEKGRDYPDSREDRRTALLMRGPEGTDQAVVLSGIDRFYSGLAKEEVSV